MPVSADRAGRLVEINEGSGLTSRVQVCRQPANRSQRWRDAHSPALTEPRSPVFKALAPIASTVEAHRSCLRMVLPVQAYKISVLQQSG